VWETVEASTRKIRVGKKEIRRSRKEKETEKGKNSGSKENSRRVGDIGGGRRSSKVRRGSKEVSAREVAQVDKDVWEEAIGENAHKKSVGSYNRHKGEIHTEKREGVPFVERRKGGS